jgi:hypothetical protein
MHKIVRNVQMRIPDLAHYQRPIVHSHEVPPILASDLDMPADPVLVMIIHRRSGHEP